MGIAYLNNGAIELPNVRAQKGQDEVIGDLGRTAGGKMRRDVVAVKRIWSLECPYLTNAQYDLILNHLRGLMYGPTTFWLDEMGGAAAANSIAAFVEIGGDERVQFGSGGAWVSDGHSITLTVREQ